MSLDEAQFTLHLRSWIPAALASAMLALAGADANWDWNLPDNYYRALRVIVTAASLHLLLDALTIRAIRLSGVGSWISECRSRVDAPPEKTFDPEEGWHEYLQELEDSDEDRDDTLTEAETTRARETWDADVDERLENWKAEHPFSSRHRLIKALRADESSNYGFGRVWILAGLAVVFNPFQPILLTVETWSVVDLGAAFSFALLASDIRASRRQVVEQNRNEVSRLEAEIIDYEERQQVASGESVETGVSGS